MMFLLRYLCFIISLSHFSLCIDILQFRCLQFKKKIQLIFYIHSEYIFNYYVNFKSNFCPKMSQTQTENSPVQSQLQTQSEKYEPKTSKSVNKSKSKKTNKSPSKQQKKQLKLNHKKIGAKIKQQKTKQQKKQQKAKQQKKDAAKRKPKSKKQGKKEGGGNKLTVLEYMQKQNRPYNLLNIFDNLHGKIKKPELQIILNQLSQEGQFSCKQFGKNKVYYLNQQKFDLDVKQVQQLSSTYTHLKQQQKQLKDLNKNLNDQFRKLISKKTFQQLQVQSYAYSNDIQKLKKKKQYLTGQDIQKIDQQVVLKIQKQTQFLQKQLKRRKKLTKECLQMWSQMTQKKVSQLAEIMGIQLQ